MILIDTLAKIGKGLEKAVEFTVESIYNSGKYVFDSPREIKKMSDERQAKEDHKFLFQIALYHKGEARLNGIQKLKTKYPAEYNEILSRINQDNDRLGIEQMMPVVIEPESEVG